MTGSTCDSDDLKFILDFFLLIGQANMAGRARIPADKSGPLAQTYLFNDCGVWEPASHPLNRYSTIRKELALQAYGPGGEFARVLLERGMFTAVGLVVNCRGGTAISEWRQGSLYFDEAVCRVRQAQHCGVLRGILWHQGESDAENSSYFPAVKKLLVDLRTQIGLNVPVVVGEVHQAESINDQMQRLPAVLPKVACVSSEGLSTFDRWHFDAPSVTQLGNRYGLAMSGLLL